MTRFVYLVDDEDVIRRSAGLMLRMSGWQVTAFESGATFLGSLGGLQPGCVLLDIRMPGIDGLEVQKEMTRRDVGLPIIMMTGHGDVAVAVSALKAGAVDFIEKPFEKARMLDALDRAALKLDNPEAYEEVRQHARQVVAELSDDERSVLTLLAQGHANQAVGAMLEMPVARVELHRAAIIQKTGGSSLPDAIRLAFLAEIRDV